MMLIEWPGPSLRAVALNSVYRVFVIEQHKPHILDQQPKRCTLFYMPADRSGLAQGELQNVHRECRYRPGQGLPGRIGKV